MPVRGSLCARDREASEAGPPRDARRPPQSSVPCGSGSGQSLATSQVSQYRLRVVMRRALLEADASPPPSRSGIPGVNFVCGLLALTTRTHDLAFQSSPLSRRAWLCNIVALAYFFWTVPD
eukprot:7174272-Pyramimonas_sp.AAC.1